MSTPEDPEMAEDDPSEPPFTKRGFNLGGVQISSDNSTVGIMAGVVRDSAVSIVGTPPRMATAADLAAELTALRAQLARERSVGKVDDPTYQAAQAELDIADKELAADTKESRSRFVMALKRLRGLVADVTDVGTKIAALITAVRELSQDE
jgi:adenosylhomocysteine nucleosidase